MPTQEADNQSLVDGIVAHLEPLLLVAIEAGGLDTAELKAAGYPPDWSELLARNLGHIRTPSQAKTAAHLMADVIVSDAESAGFGSSGKDVKMGDVRSKTKASYDPKELAEGVRRWGQ